MTFGNNSKIFPAFLTDTLNQTAAFDLNSHTLKAALFNDTTTPNQTAAAASTGFNTGVWTTGNEVANGGWSSGGLSLASVTSGFSSNVYTLDAADVANGSAATLSDVRGCLVYDDSLTTPVADQGISYHSFGGAQAVTAGTFTVVWNASGIFSLTL
ncbi:hypothetical protein ACIBCH_20600 [Amycolatopsis thailandensis]|uniref:hypothetical protein n=1 Tax=Amycolatopsis thailandensis TaxID=589330 RepID=UPI003798333C